MTANGNGDVRPLRPDALFKQITMPGWIELHVLAINLRTPSATRYAACAVDAWESSPAAPTPEKPDRSRMTIWAIRKVEKAAHLAAESAAAATRMRRESPAMSTEDMKALRSMHDSTEGKLAYAAAVIAADIEHSPAWTDHYFARHHTPVDLFRQVTDIAVSARGLVRAKEELGPKPPRALEQDSDVMEVFRHHTQLHQRRLEAITQRVQVLLRYRDNVLACEPIIEKRKWLAKHDHRGDSVQFIDEAADSLAGEDLARATDEVEHNTATALAYLAEDARRLSRAMS